LENRRRSAVTLFRMTPKIDEGKIVSMRWFDIPERAYAMDVYRLVAESLRDSFVELVGNLDGSDLPETHDSGLKSSIYARRTPADGWIDFDSSADSIDRLVRAVSQPYPGAYADWEARPVTFHRVEPASALDRSYHGLPGQVLRKKRGMLLVQCGDVPLWLGNSAEDVAWQATYREISLGSRFGRRVEDDLHDIEARLTRIERQLGIT
jgi:methionyl-tRNA formyltransferase